MSLLCLALFFVPFPFYKGESSAPISQRERKKTISWEREKDEKYPERIFSHSKVRNSICTCTKAACTSRVMTKVDTKCVGVISIDLFHRNISLRYDEKFHCGKIEFSPTFRLPSQSSFTFQSTSLKSSHNKSLNILSITIFHNLFRKT